eukprot:scaffold23398_cov76-Isochrysis_galbana.AAC.1
MGPGLDPGGTPISGAQRALKFWARHESKNSSLSMAHTSLRRGEGAVRQRRGAQPNGRLSARRGLFLGGARLVRPGAWFFLFCTCASVTEPSDSNTCVCSTPLVDTLIASAKF